MKIEDKKQFFTIPNILTYLRILAVPFIIAFTVAKSTYISGYPLIGFIILISAASTDIVDGWIARRFNQVSNVGKLLDPLADKLMHVGTLLALVIAGNVHFAFIVALLLKEGLMIAGGIVISGKTEVVIPANMLGKVASATISAGVLTSYFHLFFKEKVFYLDWIILSVGIILTYVAFFIYLKMALPTMKKIIRGESFDSETEKKEDTEDKE